MEAFRRSSKKAKVEHYVASSSLLIIRPPSQFLTSLHVCLIRYDGGGAEDSTTQNKRQLSGCSKSEPLTEPIKKTSFFRAIEHAEK